MRRALHRRCLFLFLFLITNIFLASVKGATLKDAREFDNRITIGTMSHKNKTLEEHFIEYRNRKSIISSVSSSNSISSSDSSSSSSDESDTTTSKSRGTTEHGHTDAESKNSGGKSLSEFHSDTENNVTDPTVATDLDTSHDIESSFSLDEDENYSSNHQISSKSAHHVIDQEEEDGFDFFSDLDDESKLSPLTRANLEMFSKSESSGSKNYSNTGSVPMDGNGTKLLIITSNSEDERDQFIEAPVSPQIYKRVDTNSVSANLKSSSKQVYQPPHRNITPLKKKILVDDGIPVNYESSDSLIRYR